MAADWVHISKWGDCAALERPGIVFELRNVDGQSLFTQCSPTLPPVPFDWKSPPVMFRAIPAPKPQHSSPMPKHKPKP